MQGLENGVYVEETEVGIIDPDSIVGAAAIP
jgi:hypothetical protein